MKEKKSALTELVDKLFKKNIRRKFKSKMIYIPILTSILVITPITVGCILLTSKKEEKHKSYDFLGKNFKNKDDIYKYAYENSNKLSFKYDTNTYKYNNKLFNTKNSMNDYIKQKFKITEEYTMRNPRDFTINSSGELSSDVITSNNEYKTKVYKGYDKSAYLTKDKALESYMNYESSVFADGIEFNNESDARKYYEDIKIKELEKNGGKSTCYLQSGICQTEQEIKSWLRKNIVKGYEYQGKSFSEYNYSEFLNSMKPLDQKISREYIKEVVNADMKSYWAQVSDLDLNNGYLIGPKYFESSEEIDNTKLSFEQIDSVDINPVIAYSYAMTFSSMTSTSLELTSPWSNRKGPNSYNPVEYLNYLGNKIKWSKEGKKGLEILLLPYNSNKLKKVAVDLELIKDPEFKNFHKLLVVFDKFLFLDKVNQSSTQYDLPLERYCVHILADIINQQDKMVSNIFSNDSQSGLEVLQDASFKDIYSLFINVNKFYNKGGVNQKILNAVTKFQKLAEIVMNPIENISKIKDDIKDTFTNKNTSQQQIDKSMNNINVKNQNIIRDNSINIYKGMGFKGLDNNKARSFGSNLMSGLNWIGKAWSISQALSFMSIVTFEAKLDKNTSLFYTVPTLKIPILNIAIQKPDPKVEVIKLSDSPLNYLLPKNTSKTFKIVYEYKGKYYLHKDLAESDLVQDIFQEPEKFLQTNKLFANVMNKEKFYKLKDPRFNKTINSDEGFTAAEYHKKLAEEKELYIKQIFEENYVINKKDFYLDGFGNGFEVKSAAISSLKENLAKANFNKKFYYIMKGAARVYRDTEEEIIDFIKNNQVVENKLIISSDLIKNNDYESLKEFQSDKFYFYKLNYFGEFKYFKTLNQAWNFLNNNINYQVINKEGNVKTFSINNKTFLSERDFEQWIEKNINDVYS